MALTTKLRPPLRPLPTPSLSHSFSSSSNPDNPTSNPTTEDPPKSSVSSYFRDLKASLKQQPPPPPHYRPYNPRPLGSDPSSKISSLGEIQKNLSEFRRRSAPPPPSSPSGNPVPASKPVSFQDLFKRNVIAKEGEDNNKGVHWNSIRESLRNIQSKTASNVTMKSNDMSNVGPKTSYLGFDSLPSDVFGKELEKKESDDDGLKGEFFRSYSYEDLGMRLMKLRPEKKKGDKEWFSLQELSERLHKLRVIDEKEMQSGPNGYFKDIRETMYKLSKSNMEKKTDVNVLKIDMLNNLGAEQDFMLLPPKEQLVEKYFHPDNMSSAEKLKIELKKVRDEYKMSESDCGSARVQVAQLTTKIKHLSTALHKKDKHSRKGLQAMVQLRKKLLKYLRRTDWDSYCMVLSKLGLRDNPDYKN